MSDNYIFRDSRNKNHAKAMVSNDNLSAASWFTLNS